MEILGIGGWELVAILLIMLIVAGPKRMIAWSYTLGRWVGQARHMWSETAKVIQKEFDDAGIDIQVPEQPPTRASLASDMSRMLAPVTQPLKDAMNEVEGELNNAKQAASIPGVTTKTSTTPPKPTGSKVAPTPKPPVPAPDAKNSAAKNGNAPAATAGSAGNTASFGTWSGNAAATPAAPKPGTSGFGSWSSTGASTPPAAPETRSGEPETPPSTQQ